MGKGVVVVNLLLDIFILPCPDIVYGGLVFFVDGTIQQILKILQFYSVLCGFASLLALVAVVLLVFVS